MKDDTACWEGLLLGAFLLFCAGICIYQGYKSYMSKSAVEQYAEKANLFIAYQHGKYDAYQKVLGEKPQYESDYPIPVLK